MSEPDLGASRPSDTRVPCIWCGAVDYAPSLEHILPEALGCPPQFVLEDGVCKACNNGLAHLDRALLRQFELVTFIGNVRRKGGKGPSVDSWGSIRGRQGPDGAELHINGGPGAVEMPGGTLKPVQVTREFEHLRLEASGVVAKLTFSQRFGDDPKFIRALYKVAFGSAVFWLGQQATTEPEIAAVKKFVRKGRGAFSIVFLGQDGPQEHRFDPPFRSDETGALVVGMRIFGIDLVVDFDPEQRSVRRMRQQLETTGAANWTILPITT